MNPPPESVASLAHKHESLKSEFDAHMLDYTEHKTGVNFKLDALLDTAKESRDAAIWMKRAFWGAGIAAIIKVVFDFFVAGARAH